MNENVNQLNSDSDLFLLHRNDPIDYKFCKLTAFRFFSTYYRISSHIIAHYE